MGPKVIVSYDDTANDRDALALGRVFASAGATVSLAYVRHTKESEHAQERLEEREAQALLERGAQALGGNVQRHVVLSASTGEGLWQLAERERADIVVFGSEYRTPVGRVSPGTSATRLLEERGSDWGNEHIEVARWARFSQYGPINDAFMATGDWAKARRVGPTPVGPTGEARKCPRSA